MVLITIFGPLLGAHFNPVVCLMFGFRRELSWAHAVAYIAVQVIGAILGVSLAHAMFAEPLIQVSTKLRDGWPQGLAEGVATFGLIATILGSLRFSLDTTPVMVGLYITAGLLVHGVHVLHQPGCDGGAQPVPHLRWDRAHIGAVIHHLSAC